MNQAHKASKLRNRRNRLLRQAKSKTGINARQRDRLNALN